jgi:hypothetical protein
MREKGSYARASKDVYAEEKALKRKLRPIVRELYGGLGGSMAGHVDFN